MQLCYWHNKPILLLSMCVCVCLRDRIILFHVMLCIIELVLAGAEKAHAEKIIFLFLFSIWVFQFHIERITDRMLFCGRWSTIPYFVYSFNEMYPSGNFSKCVYSWHWFIQSISLSLCLYSHICGRPWALIIGTLFRNGHRKANYSYSTLILFQLIQVQ